MPRKPKSKPAVITTQWQIAENMFSWYRNSLHWYEMMNASATTIALRLSGIQRSIQSNEIPDTVEWLRMFSEKNQAMAKSASAVEKWQAAVFKPYTWPVASAPWQAFDASSSAADNLLAQNVQWSKMMLQGFANTMRPFHSASTANARRLSSGSKP